MRSVTALMVVMACMATAGSTSAGTEGKAVLGLVDRDPLTVKGEGFAAKERLRVHASVSDAPRASVPDTQRRMIRANTIGSFRVVFSDIALDRCDLARVVALRRQGSQVILKVLPPPMCKTMRAP